MTVTCRNYRLRVNQPVPLFTSAWLKLLRRFSFLACGQPRTICCAISHSASSYRPQAHRCGHKVLVNVGSCQRACTHLVRLSLSPSVRPTSCMLRHREGLTYLRVCCSSTRPSRWHLKLAQRAKLESKETRGYKLHSHTRLVLHT